MVVVVLACPAGKYDAFETTLEVLRVQQAHPDADPKDYIKLDEDFKRFMYCGYDTLEGGGCLGGACLGGGVWFWGFGVESLNVFSGCLLNGCFRGGRTWLHMPRREASM